MMNLSLWMDINMANTTEKLLESAKPVDSNARKEKIFAIISWSALAVAFILFCIFIAVKIDYIIDSDNSSELLLGKLSSEYNQILVKDWYYSTEIRVFYVHLIFAFLFKFTSNMYVVRVLGTIIAVAILLASLYVFMFAISRKKLFPVMATIFLLPFSLKYEYYILYGLSYNAFLMIEFFILGTLFLSLKSKNKPAKYILFAATCVLSFVAGLAGARLVASLYMPMALAIFILFMLNKKGEDKLFWKNLFWAVFIISVLAAIGFFVNIFYLDKNYSFKAYGYANSLKLMFKPEAFEDVLVSIFAVFGSESALIVKLFSTVIYALMILWFVLFFMKKLKVNNISKFFGYTVLCGYGIMLVLGLFTNVVVFGMYMLPFLILLPFMFIDLFGFIWNKINDGALRALTFASLSIIFSLCTIMNYVYLWGCDKTEDIRNVSKYCIENGLKEGYASFWQANILIELSNGECYVRSPNVGNREYIIYAKEGEIANIDDINPWLQQKSPYETKPEGKVFVLINTIEDDWHGLNEYFKNDDYLKLTSGNLKLYVYESYEELVAVTGMEHNF